MVKYGSGSLTLTNCNNKYRGGNQVNEGTLRCGGDNVLGGGPVVVYGGVLDLGANHTENVYNVTLDHGSIIGTGNSTLVDTEGAVRCV